MKVTYKGPSPAVDIAIPGGSVRAEKGVATEVPDDIATRLAEQPDAFEVAKPSAKEK